MDYPAGSHHYAPGLLGASSQAREGGLDSSVGDSVGLAGEHSGLPRVPTTTLIRVRAAQALGPVWSGPNRRRLVCRRGMGSGPHPIPQPAVWPARVARPRLSATRSVWRASDPGRSTTPLLHPWGFPGACSGPGAAWAQPSATRLVGGVWAPGRTPHHPSAACPSRRWLRLPAGCRLHVAAHTTFRAAGPACPARPTILWPGRSPRVVALPTRGWPPTPHIGRARSWVGLTVAPRVGPWVAGRQSGLE